MKVKSTCDEAIASRVKEWPGEEYMRTDITRR